MDRQPGEYKPDVSAGSYHGHYFNDSGRPDIPVTVRPVIRRHR